MKKISEDFKRIQKKELSTFWGEIKTIAVIILVMTNTTAFYIAVAVGIIMIGCSAVKGIMEYKKTI